MPKSARLRAAAETIRREVGPVIHVVNHAQIDLGIRGVEVFERSEKEIIGA